MTVLLPDIGRNGLVGAVRRISGLNNPGYRTVDSAADFIAGMVANLEADTNGNPTLTVANATDNALIGLFYCHKTTSFYRPITNEEQTFSTSPNTSTILYLNHANVKTSSVYITSGGLAVATGWTLTAVNGYITKASTGTGTWKISYLYQDPDLSGIDQTLGSGMAATLEDQGEVATLIYDTSKAYAIMAQLYSDANGYLTTTNGGGGKVGLVTKPPTADNPELWFKLNIIKV
jgi:hypothetical protein